MSEDNPSESKKRKITNGGDDETSPVRVESHQPLQHGAASDSSMTPPDNSKLPKIQQIFFDLFQDDSNAVKHAFYQLSVLCFQNAQEEENRATVVRLGGSLTIVGAMKKWYAFPVVQAEACRALQNIAYKNATFKVGCIEVGVLDAILWAMKKYPKDSLVQAYASGAVANLVLLRANAEYIVNHPSNGVGLIVSAMKAFQNSSILQKWASCALNNLLQYDDDADATDDLKGAIKKAIDKADGRRALLDTFENHKDESKPFVKEIRSYTRSALIESL